MPDDDETRRDDTTNTTNTTHGNHVAHTQLCMLARCIAMARLPLSCVRNACVICTSVHIWGAGEYCSISNASGRATERPNDGYVFVTDNNYVFINCRSKRVHYTTVKITSPAAVHICQSVAEYLPNTAQPIGSMIIVWYPNRIVFCQLPVAYKHAIVCRGRGAPQLLKNQQQFILIDSVWLTNALFGSDRITYNTH